MRRALASLCLVVQLVALVHLLVERHEVCATHGEVTHADGHGAAGVEVDHADDPAHARFQAAGSDADEAHADDHCGVLGERRDLARAAMPVLHAQVAHAVPPPFAPPAAPVPALARYRLAPKTSPPVG